MHAHTHRYGQCLLYRRDWQNRGSPCDVFYEIGVDRVFLPTGRSLNNLAILTQFAADASIIRDVIEEPCR